MTIFGCEQGSEVVKTEEKGGESIPPLDSISCHCVRILFRYFTDIPRRSIPLSSVKFRLQADFRLRPKGIMTDSSLGRLLNE